MSRPETKSATDGYQVLMRGDKGAGRSHWDQSYLAWRADTINKYKSDQIVKISAHSNNGESIVLD